jgi:AraC-like DNA-binding protein
MATDIAFIKSFVTSNLGRVRKTQHVAEQLNCPLDQLKRSFYRSEKRTLSRFIRETRIERMKDELAKSDSPCKVICIDLGMREDVGARLFKNATGLTMEEFRKMYRRSVVGSWRSQPSRTNDVAATPQLILTARAVKQVLADTRSGQPKSQLTREGAIVQKHVN